MTNEWGPPLTGEEMRALKERIDTGLPTKGYEHVSPFGTWSFSDAGMPYYLPASHPYYKVHKFNQDNPDKPTLVLHDGSTKVPEDWDGRGILDKNLQFFSGGPNAKYNWLNIIAYTPKPKESEVSNFTSLDDLLDEDGIREEVTAMAIKANEDEKMPKDEAIEYVILNYGYEYMTVDNVKQHSKGNANLLELARLIQQYEPDRLTPAVDVAAEGFANKEGHTERSYEWRLSFDGFKAGAMWRKENPND